MATRHATRYPAPAGFVRAALCVFAATAVAVAVPVWGQPMRTSSRLRQSIDDMTTQAEALTQRELPRAEREERALLLGAMADRLAEQAAPYAQLAERAADIRERAQALGEVATRRRPARVRRLATALLADLRGFDFWVRVVAEEPQPPAAGERQPVSGGGASSCPP